jgi:hypothetical protein
MADLYRCPACGCSSPITGSDSTRCPKCQVALAEFAVTCPGCKQLLTGQEIKNPGYCPKCGDRYPFDNSGKSAKALKALNNKCTLGAILDAYCPNDARSFSIVARMMCGLIFSKGAPFTHIAPTSEKKMITIDGINYIGFRADDLSELIVVRASTMTHIEMVTNCHIVPKLEYLGDLELSPAAWKLWGSVIEDEISKVVSNSSHITTTHHKQSHAKQKS